MKKNNFETGLTLFEVGLYLILFTFILVCVLHTKGGIHYFYSTLNFSDKMLQYTNGFKKFLIKKSPLDFNYGVTEIPLSKIFPAYYLQDEGANLYDYSVKFYAIREKIKSGKTTDNISGLVVANPVDKKSSFSKTKVEAIEKLLLQYGGSVDTNIVEGNFGGWVLDLNKLNFDQPHQIVAYIPTIFPLSGRASTQVKTINYRICSLGKCEILPLQEESEISWAPLYFDDCLSFFFQKMEYVDYYIILIKNKNDELIKTMAAKSVFVLEPDDISNGAFHVTIKPVSSMPGETLQGVEFELKKMLPNPRLPDLWTSFDISVAIDGTSSNNFQSKTLQQINGKITEANFFSSQNKKLLYDIKLQFCNNDFIFYKNSTLDVNYINNTYAPWFHNKEDISVCVDPSAVKPYPFTDVRIYVNEEQSTFPISGVSETPIDSSNRIHIKYQT
ncbi:hypothetical protein AT845_004578 [Escherichia coli]|nr:hypothetical protein [Escherichia coli]